MPYVWTGPVPVGSYDDEPALILPDWLGPRELGQIEETTGGRILEVPSTDRVQVWRADGDGGWIDLGYVDNFEIEQADRLRHEYGRSLGEILRAHKLEVQFQAPHEFVQDWAQAYPWATSRPADWVELWSRHMLNGPAALLGRGWRSGRLRWSERAIRTLADCYPRAEQRTRVLWAWASTPEIQGTPEPHPHQALFDRIEGRQKLYAEQWSQLLNSVRSDEVWEQAGYPPELINQGFYDAAALVKGGTVTTDMVNSVLQRSWEGPQESPYDQAFGRGARERAIRQGQTTWDEDEYDG